MSKLDFFRRPWVAFDAHNKQHRRWYAEFQKYGTWGRTPVRFIFPNEQGDLISMIHNSLIDYYVTEEFGENTIDKEDKVL